MAYPSVTFRDILSASTLTELDQFCSLLQGYLNTQHNADGSHRAITAESVSADGAGTFGGDVTAQSGSANGAVQVGALSSVLPSISDKRGVLIAGTSGVALLRYGRSGAFTGAGSLFQFALWNLNSSANNAWLQIADDSGVPTLIDGGSGSGGLNLGNGTRPITLLTATAADVATLRATGIFQTKKGSNLALVNGLNSNVDVGATSFVAAITGPSAAFQIGGIVAGADGQWLSIHHNTGQVLTLNHNDGGSTAANRIFCPGAAAVATSANFGTALLQYNSAIPGWIVHSWR